MDSPSSVLARRGGLVECLRVPAALFGALVRARGALYDRGLLPIGRVDLPVVSVGNLTTGGVGKTPMVRWLVERFRARGLVPGVLSRGYRARAGERSDEARELGADDPALLHVEDPDRCRGAAELLARGADVIVLDDGFQHRRIHRDLDLVLVDATCPWGLPARGGASAVRALLPRGLLREPPAALARADAIVVTRADQASDAEREALVREIEGLAPGRPIALAAHEPLGLRRVRGGSVPLAELAGREVALASGIGNPTAFEATVARLGGRIAEHRARRDHHAWDAADLAGLDGRPLVTTAKDAVKLAALAPDAWVLDVRFALRSGAGPIEALLDALPLAARARRRDALHAGLHG